MDLSHIEVLEVQLESGETKMPPVVVLYNAEKITKEQAIKTATGDRSDFAVCISQKQWIELFCNGKDDLDWQPA